MSYVNAPRRRRQLRSLVLVVAAGLLPARALQAQTPLGDSLRARVERALRPLGAESDSAIARVLRLSAMKVGALMDGARAPWPGMFAAPARIGFYPYLGGTLTVGNAARPPGDAVPPLFEAGERSARYQLLPGFLPHDFFPTHALAVELPEGLDVAVSLLPPSPETVVKDSVRLTVMFGIHEFFHAYQNRRFAPLRGTEWDALANPLPPPVQWIASDGGVSQLRAERALLAALVRVRDPSRLRAGLGQYYALRGRRLAGRAEENFEAHLERLEGVAEFVGLTGTQLALGFPEDSLVADIGRLLEAPQFSVPESNRWERYRWWHVNAAGLAKALLASRVNPRWTRDVEAGCSLDDVLRARCPAN